MNLNRAIECRSKFGSAQDYIRANLHDINGPFTITNISRPAYWYDVWGQIDNDQANVLRAKPAKATGYKMQDKGWRLLLPGEEFDAIDQIVAAVEDEVLYFIP